MKKRVGIISAMLMGAFILAPLSSFAGGTIQGKVSYSGKPVDKEFLFSKFPNPKFCPKNPNKELVHGEKRILKSIEVGAGGALKGAVVAVADIDDQIGRASCRERVSVWVGGGGDEKQ